MNTAPWEKKVTDYLNQLNQDISKNEELNSLYYGFEVIDGQLLLNPEILFVGINPGKGNGIKHNSIKFCTEQVSYLDIYDDNYKYQLAKDTINLFEIMGFDEAQTREKLSNQVVKTNLYHIATNGMDELNMIKRSYPELYHKSISFLLELIGLINPKVVIFEGKSVYKEIVEDIYEIFDSWDNELKVGKAFSEKENVWFLGYERKFSNIQNQNHVARILKEIIK